MEIKSLKIRILKEAVNLNALFRSGGINEMEYNTQRRKLEKEVNSVTDYLSRNEIIKELEKEDLTREN